MTENEVTIYRLRLSKGTADSHVPDWTLYDDRAEFERACLEAALEAESRLAGENRIEKGPSRWLTQVWHRLHYGETEKFGVNRVRAEMLEDGEWVDLDIELVPPRVLLYRTMD